MSTIEQVSGFLKVKPSDLIKTLIVSTDVGPAAVLIRGEHDLNEVKVKNFLKAAELEFADARTIEEVTGGPLGFSGPVGLRGLLFWQIMPFARFLQPSWERMKRICT